RPPRGVNDPKPFSSEDQAPGGSCPPPPRFQTQCSQGLHAGGTRQEPPESSWKKVRRRIPEWSSEGRIRVEKACGFRVHRPRLGAGNAEIEPDAQRMGRVAYTR